MFPASYRDRYTRSTRTSVAIDDATDMVDALKSVAWTEPTLERLGDSAKRVSMLVTGLFHIAPRQYQHHAPSWTPLFLVVDFLRGRHPIFASTICCGFLLTTLHDRIVAATLRRRCDAAFQTACSKPSEQFQRSDTGRMLQGLRCQCQPKLSAMSCQWPALSVPDGAESVRVASLPFFEKR